MIKTYMSILGCLLLLTIVGAEIKAQDPLFPNSVVSNDIDFILGTDPDTFSSLVFIGLEDQEMPDSQTEILFDEDTFVFEASFTDGTIVPIWCHSSFLTESAAQEYAEKLCPRLGKLPNVQRSMLDHVVIHNGDAGAYAETQGHFFILYSDNMDDRISTNDLEETVFHESVHASIQDLYENTPAWTDAQANDLAFVTEYGQSFPGLEDMAESALFAYTYITHPGRLSAEIESWLEENNPNRLEFFGNIYGAPVSVNNENNEPELSVYPNPSSDKITVNLTEVIKDSNIDILNTTGKLVQSTQAKVGQNEIWLDELPQGVYLLSVQGYYKSWIIKQ